VRWYQIKVNARWEDSENTDFGTPARVVQYDVPDSGSEDSVAVWQINDEDHSFLHSSFSNQICTGGCLFVSDACL